MALSTFDVLQHWNVNEPGSLGFHWCHSQHHIFLLLSLDQAYGDYWFTFHYHNRSRSSGSQFDAWALTGKVAHSSSIDHRGRSMFSKKAVSVLNEIHNLPQSSQQKKLPPQVISLRNNITSTTPSRAMSPYSRYLCSLFLAARSSISRLAFSVASLIFHTSSCAPWSWWRCVCICDKTVFAVASALYWVFTESWMILVCCSAYDLPGGI